MTYITSAFGKLDHNDFIKGLLVAVITAVLAFIFPAVSAHQLPSLTDTLYTGATAGIAYLIKNLFSPAAIVTEAPLPSQV